MTAEHHAGDAVKTACPLRCRRRHSTAGDPGVESSASDEVDWAGIPINLDLAFSAAQRDNVYLQHLSRRRGGQAWRWSQDGSQPCACDIAAQAAYDRGHAEKLGITS